MPYPLQSIMWNWQYWVISGHLLRWASPGSLSPTYQNNKDWRGQRTGCTSRLCRIRPSVLIRPTLNTRLARVTFSEDLRTSRSRTTKKIPEPVNIVRSENCRIRPSVLIRPTLNTRLARVTFSEDLRAQRSRTTKKISEPVDIVRSENCRIRPSVLIRPTLLLRSPNLQKLNEGPEGEGQKLLRLPYRHFRVFEQDVLLAFEAADDDGATGV